MGSAPHDEELPQLGFWEATFWMGTKLSALRRILSRESVPRSHWLGCGIDLGFAAANSGLSRAQHWAFRKRLEQQLLPRDPVFILGHWRTGTTWLHELLALDPRHRAPTTYECLNPNHMLLTERWLKHCTQFCLPKHRPPDAMAVGWDLPQEDEFALMNLGLPSIYTGIAFPNQTWPDQSSLELEQLPPEVQQRWLERWSDFLRGLLLQRPGRLVLKSPQHTFRIPTLERTFPHAKYVYLTRDPLKVIPSTIKLWKSLSAVHGYGLPMRETLVDEVLQLFVRLDQRFEHTKTLIPPERLKILRYEDFVRDPVAELRDIYEQFNLGDFTAAENRLREILAAKGEYRPNRHSLDDVLREKIASSCSEYAGRFGYEIHARIAGE